MKYYRERIFFYLDYMKMHTIFFFTCTNYTNARNNYFHKLLQLGHFCVINTHLLLWGDESLSTIINNQLIFSVFALPFFCNSICTFCSKYSCKFLYVFVRFYFNGEDHISFFKLVPEPFVFFEIQ